MPYSLYGEGIIGSAKYTYSTGEYTEITILPSGTSFLVYGYFNGQTVYIGSAFSDGNGGWTL
jgi:hypothetical protein